MLRRNGLHAEVTGQAAGEEQAENGECIAHQNGLIVAVGVPTVYVSEKNSLF